MRFLLFPFLCSGCMILGPNLEGDWEGDCEIDGYSYDLNLEIEEDDGGELEGEAEVDLSGTVFSGDLEGERDGTEVAIEFRADYGGYYVEMELEGDYEDDTIEGDCEILTGSGGKGDLELELD